MVQAGSPVSWESKSSRRRRTAVPRGTGEHGGREAVPLPACRVASSCRAGRVLYITSSNHTMTYGNVAGKPRLDQFSPRFVRHMSAA